MSEPCSSETMPNLTDSSNPDVSIIIVNYNAGELLRHCISSINSYKGSLSLEKWVVDNASDDGSADFLEGEPAVRFLRNDRNLGFARANNQALSQVKGETILLLNPDTLVLPNTLETMAAFLHDHPEVGAVCPRTYLDEARTLEIGSLKIPNPLNSLCIHTPLRRLLLRNPILERVWRQELDLWKQACGPYYVAGIGGACFMVRRDVFQRIGLLDERFYMGYEDTDWSLRITSLGYRIAILTDAVIIHFHGQSKKKVDPKQLPIAQWQKGLLPFLSVHYPGAGTWSFAQVKRWSERVSRSAPRLRRSKASRASQDEVVAVSGEPILLRWPETDTQMYLLELSNSPVFFDKYGARSTSAGFQISSDIIGRLAPGRYWWRVYPWEYELSRPLAHGAIVVP